MDQRSRGFTLIEMMIVVAIIGILAAVATVSLSRGRPRAQLAGTATELQALVHGARQQALATGHDVAVLAFPGWVAPGGSVGRLIVYEDGDFSLFDVTAAVNLDGYDPSTLTHGPRSQIVTTLDLPRGITIGPAAGRGAGAALPAPWVAVPVDSDCSFCDGAGAARRGAVVFDSKGRARFQATNGPPLAVAGGSLSLTAPELGDDVRTLVVGASTGAVRTIAGP